MRKPWGINWKYPGSFNDSQEKDPQIVSAVANYLDMWNFIEEGYAQLSTEEKGQLERDADPFGKRVSFPGFDGNNEIEYASVAAFLVNELELIP